MTPKRQLEQHRWQQPEPISRSRPERLLLAAERLEAELEAERAGNEAYEHTASSGRTRRAGGLAARRSRISRPRSRRGR